MRKTFWVFLGGFLLLLMACRLDFRTDFQDTESGNVRISWAVTAEEEQMLASLDAGTAEDLCNEMKDEMMADEEEEATVTFREESDGTKVCTIQGPFKSLDELKEIYGDDTIINKLGEEDGKFYYDITVSPIDTGDAELDIDMPPITFTWQVTMPGNVIEHNGDSINGQTITWTIAGQEPRRLTAVSKTSGFSFSLTGGKAWLLLGVCLCLPLLLIVVGVILWLAKRKKADAADVVAPTTNVSAGTDADWTE